MCSYVEYLLNKRNRNEVLLGKPLQIKTPIKCNPDKSEGAHQMADALSFTLLLGQEDSLEGQTAHNEKGQDN